MQPIHLSFPFTLADRLRASFELIPHAPRTMVLAAIFPLMALGYLALRWFSGRPLDSGTWIFVGYLLAFYPVIVVIGVTATHFANKQLREPFDYRLDELGIHVSAASYEYTHRWPAISHVRRSRTFLLLFFTPTCAHCIPLRIVNAAGVREQIITLAKQHGAAVRGV